MYDTSAPKKPTNLSVNKDLLKRARLLNLNLSQVLEERLAEILRQQERESWRTDNEDAINQYNRRIADKGPFSNGIRRF